jgi:hypothetical protein
MFSRATCTWAALLAGALVPLAACRAAAQASPPGDWANLGRYREANEAKRKGK